MSLINTISPYPPTARSGSVFSYFGIEVPDPYDWLEEAGAPAVEDWVRQQERLTQDYMAQLPQYGRIRHRLEQLLDYEQYSNPMAAGGYVYYYRRSGLQDQPVLYRQAGGEEPEVFLDVNVDFSEGVTSLAQVQFSRDGSLAACQLSSGGSDWRTVVVIRAADKTILEDRLTGVRFSALSWNGNAGFYYTCYDLPGRAGAGRNKTGFAKLCYHRIGTAQENDIVVFDGGAEPRRFIMAYLTEDERFLVIGSAMAATGNDLFIQDLGSADGSIRPVIRGFDTRTSIIGNADTRLYVLTDLEAPNFRLVTVDASDPRPECWKNLLAETGDVLSAGSGGGTLFASYLKDASSHVLQYTMDGRLIREVALPAAGTAWGFGAGASDNELYYTFTSYLQPPVLYRYNIATGASAVFKQARLPFDPSDYVSRQVFYHSADGTRIPMMVTHRKDIVLDGRSPALLYGYGGFGISITPGFQPSNILLLEQGGIYAVPNLRGGGEYGRGWHEAGRRMNKRNSFADFVAAAHYLFENKYSSPSLLAIGGASNGGLLVGAVMTAYPGLCRVALPSVGVMDMLRYHRWPAGMAWAGEYGTSEESEEMFAYLYGYSPYHALRPGIYPATLVITADRDDRVAPAHSFKFAARLQEVQEGNDPVLLRVEKTAGHGGGRSTSQVISEEADKWTFLFENMGLSPIDFSGLRMG